MHVGRRADPDDVEIGNGQQVGPILHRGGVRRVLLAKFLRALVGGIRDGHDFDLRMLLQSRQVPVPHDGAGADDSDPQLVVVRPAHLMISE